MSREWSIARRLLVAHGLSIVMLTAFVGTALFVDARDHSFDETEERMLSVATTIADSPLTLQASTAANPSALLQAYSLDVTRDADLDFITIMAPDRTRWTHPTPTEIGKSYIGTIEPALGGRSFTEISTGTLGPSVRAVAPVMDASGTVVALVAAGVTTSNVTIALNARLPALLALAVGLLLAGSVMALVLARYLHRVTLGWGPEHLAQLFVYYDSVLHSVREGLVLVDRTGQLVLYNDQAARLLGIPPDAPHRPSQALSDLNLPPDLGALLRSGRRTKDEVFITDTRVLVINQEEAVALSSTGSGAGGGVGIRSKNREKSGRKSRRTAPVRIGSVATIRDHTDLQTLGSELQSMRTLSDALRAQTHEHSNRLHTIVSLMELGRTQEALDFATTDLELSQQLTDDMVNSVDEPVISALIMGKVAQANELGIALTVTAAGTISDSELSVQDLVTVLGNLIDNALDAAASAPPPRLVTVGVSRTAEMVILEVADSGPGIEADAADHVMQLGYSTKENGGYGRGLGLALVRQAVVRLGGTLTIGRRDGALFTVTIPTTGTGAGLVAPAGLVGTATPVTPEGMRA
ncbi:sensor histidine kinase [Cryobacterium sp. CG_9.6]|uniref:sensor histidine kinase n=1 Tax=Cryobacterium sp. CG_9.6 TaxID=2760710 RepID=UPI002472FDFC|nr:sensor histidine kinase [Cryobacterium sp. CG_9.6]MDH6236354.1 sensor histidine kinase regulating citrate/malate metabolism [Cryobacterium sp. CG_9.6]